MDNNVGGHIGFNKGLPSGLTEANVLKGDNAVLRQQIQKGAAAMLQLHKELQIANNALAVLVHRAGGSVEIPVPEQLQVRQETWFRVKMEILAPETPDEESSIRFVLVPPTTEERIAAGKAKLDEDPPANGPKIVIP